MLGLVIATRPSTIATVRKIMPQRRRIARMVRPGAGIQCMGPSRLRGALDGS